MGTRANACLRKRGPEPKNAASGAPRGERVSQSARTLRKRDDFGCASRRSAPLVVLEGRTHEGAAARRHKWQAERWLFDR